VQTTTNTLNAIAPVRQLGRQQSKTERRTVGGSKVARVYKKHLHIDFSADWRVLHLSDHSTFPEDGTGGSPAQR
jgi:hypothetical protein